MSEQVISAHTATTSGSDGPSQSGVVLTDVSKAFPGTLALDSVSFEIRPGEVHALCGGNGSGKSTLIKILSGVIQADSGAAFLAGQTVELTEMSAKISRDLGVRVVHQDLGVFLDLSVAENMVLGTSDYPMRAGAGISWKAVAEAAKVQIKRYDIAATPQTLLRDLPVATRTQVAIARALRGLEPGGGLVILDEPTASLTAHESQVLHDVVRRLAADGHAVLFVSHRLDEVLELSDRVTILRDGRVVEQMDVEGLTEKQLIRGILGDSAPELRRTADRQPGDFVLEVEGLTAGPLVDVSFDLRAGEVLGVAGLVGSGRTELLRAIYADLPVKAGAVRIKGKATKFKRPDQAIGAGVVMIPEDRVKAGVFADFTVHENLDVGVLPQFWRGIGFHRTKMREEGTKLRERFRIRASSGDVLLLALSGGNQQKAVLARWLRRDPLVMLLDEPTQGVDVGARADIYQVVRELTDAGSAAVLVTSDLEELSQVCDRAIVLNSGSIVAEVAGNDLTAQNLSELIYMKKTGNHE